jgi:hypothetical protein
MLKRLLTEGRRSDLHLERSLGGQCSEVYLNPVAVAAKRKKGWMEVLFPVTENRVGRKFGKSISI